MTGGIDAELSKAGLASQLAIEAQLCARATDDVPGIDLAGIAIDLVGARLADVSEHVRGERAERVGTNVARGYFDARELVGSLKNVRAREAADVLPDDHRVERVGLPTLVDAPGKRAERDVEHVREPLHHLIAVRLLAGLGKIRRPDHDDATESVADEHGAVTVENGTSRSLQAHGANLVVPGNPKEIVAGEDLKRPQAQQEQREQNERERTENARSEHRLGIDAPGLLRSRIAGEEGP